MACAAAVGLERVGCHRFHIHSSVTRREKENDGGGGGGRRGGRRGRRGSWSGARRLQLQLAEEAAGSTGGSKGYSEVRGRNVIPCLVGSSIRTHPRTTRLPPPRHRTRAFHTAISFKCLIWESERMRTEELKARNRACPTVRNVVSFLIIWKPIFEFPYIFTDHVALRPRTESGKQV